MIFPPGGGLGALSSAPPGETLGGEATIVAVVTAPHHGVAFANDAFRRTFPAGDQGRRVTLTDNPWPGLAVPWQRVVEMVDLVQRTGEPQLCAETPVLGRDAAGGPRQLFLTVACSPLTDDDAVSVLVMAVDTTESVSARLALEQGQARLRESEHQHRGFSLTLQRSLLPPRRPVADDLDVAVRYQAGTLGAEVGGDWYDVLNLGAGRVAVVIGDVMGQGMAAAALMGQLRAAVRSLQHLDLSPAEVLRLLDRLVDDLQAGAGPADSRIVTCVYAVYDPGDEVLVYSSAGHLPPVMLEPDGTARLLAGPGSPPLGVGYGGATQHEVPIQPGSVLVLYTDGLVEDRLRDIDQGIEQLRRTPCHTDDLEELADRILDSLSPAGGYDDDVALLLLRVPRRPVSVLGTRRTSIVIPHLPQAAGHARGHARRVLDRWRVPADVAQDALLAVGELVANAIVHGDPPIRLDMRRNAHRLVIQVSDGNLRPPREARPASDAESGRGLRIVAEISSRWGERTLPTSKIVWAELALPDRGDADDAQTPMRQTPTAPPSRQRSRPWPTGI